MHTVGSGPVKLNAVTHVELVTGDRCTGRKWPFLEENPSGIRLLCTRNGSCLTMHTWHR